MQLLNGRCSADCDPAVTRDGRHEYGAEQLAVSPECIPLAIQSAASRDQKWTTTLDVPLGKRMKAFEDRVLERSTNRDERRTVDLLPFEVFERVVQRRPVAV